MSENFAELFEESLATIDMQPGSIVTGVVIDIDSDWITVHAGLKSEGIIPRSEFVTEGGELTLEIGDEVQVALEVGGIQQQYHRGGFWLIGNLTEQGFTNDPLFDVGRGQAVEARQVKDTNPAICQSRMPDPSLDRGAGNDFPTIESPADCWSSTSCLATPWAR